jgi:hypothetical protein
MELHAANDGEAHVTTAATSESAPRSTWACRRLKLALAVLEGPSCMLIGTVPRPGWVSRHSPLVFCSLGVFFAGGRAAAEGRCFCKSD